MAETLEYLIKISAKTQSLDALNNKLNSTQNAISSISGLPNSFFNSIGDAALRLNNILQAADTIKNVLAAPLQVAIDAEKAQTSFEVMLGSSEKAKDMIEAMKEDAAKTPLQFSDIQKAAKTMLGFGVEADKLRESILRIGDVTQGESQRFEMMSLAFAQVAAAGRLTGQDLLQMINAGFNPLREISEITGKSIAVLKDEMSKGLISFDLVQEAFKRATSEGGKFDNMMAKIAQTTGGKFSTLKDNFEQKVLLPIGESLLPIANSVMDSLTEMIKKAQPAIAALGDTFGYIFDTFKAVANVVESAFAPAMARLQEIMDIVTSKGNIFASVFEKISNFFSETLLPIFSTLSESLLSSLTPAMEKIMNMFSGMAEEGSILDKALNSLGFILEGVGVIFSEVIFPVLGLVADALATVIGWIVDLIEGIVEIGEQLGVFEFFRDVTQGIADAFNWVSDKISDFIDFVKEATHNIRDFFDTVTFGLLSSGEAADEAIEMAQGSALTDAQNKELMTLLERDVNKLGNSLLGALGDLGIDPSAMSATSATENMKVASPTVAAQSAKTKVAMDGVTGGGAKPTTINIDISQLIGTIEQNITAANGQQELAKLQDQITDLVLRAVNQANQVVNGRG